MTGTRALRVLNNYHFRKTGGWVYPIQIQSTGLPYSTFIVLHNIEVPHGEKATF